MPKVARNYQHEDFGDLLEMISAESNLCPTCCRNAYVRSGIGEDDKWLGLYLHFFREAKAGDNLIKQLMLGQGAKLRMEDLDVLQLKVKGDSCKIRIHAGGTVSLYHNNYIILKDKSRYFTENYHRQIIKGKQNISNALRLICNYFWEKHLEVKEEKTKEAMLASRTTTELPDKMTGRYTANRLVAFWQSERIRRSYYVYSYFFKIYSIKIDGK